MATIGNVSQGLAILFRYSDLDARVTASATHIFVPATFAKLPRGSVFKSLKKLGWYQPEAENENVYDPDCDWAVKL